MAIFIRTMLKQQDTAFSSPGNFSAGRPSLTLEMEAAVQLDQIREEFEEDYSLPGTPEPRHNSLHSDSSTTQLIGSA